MLAGVDRLPIRGVDLETDCTLDDVRDDLSRPGFDVSRDAVLVFDAAAQLVGRAAGRPRLDGPQGRRHEVDVDIVATEPEVARWLVVRVTDRGRELAAERGGGRCACHQARTR